MAGYERVVQLELNEISLSIIQKMVTRGRLPTFAKIIQDWRYFETTSEDVYENIEPWIQWPSAHTGKPLTEHGLFRLGDASDLQHRQIWETLSEQGIESSVISCMNARRGNTKGGIFFPDPWAKVNDSYPENLSSLFSVISRRVQGHAVKSPNVDDVIKGFRECLRFRLPPSLYFNIALQLVRQKIDVLSRWRLAALFDQILAQLFIYILRNYRFGFNALFLNAVAHYQHHFWRNFDGAHFAKNIRAPDCNPADDPISFGYLRYDRILADIIAEADDKTLFIIASGLSQVPFVDKDKDGGFNYYRLKDHRRFAEQLGLGHLPVFPLMSRDWQIGFSSFEARTHAWNLLTTLSVEDEPLFCVSQNTEGFLFIETAFSRRVDANALIMKEDGTSVGKFCDWLQNTAVKSGHHTGIGHLWISEPNRYPSSDVERIPLTALYQLSLDALGIGKNTHSTRSPIELGTAYS